MINKKNQLFFAIKIGKVEINSIGKSIKTITLKEKSDFVLFNLNCTPSMKHIKYCFDCITEKNRFNAVEFLKKLTGKKQVKEAQNKTELDKTRKACLIVTGKNRKKVNQSIKRLQKIIGLKEEKKINEMKRLKKLVKKEKIQLKSFGEDFYSSVDNFFIERSALVI